MKEIFSAMDRAAAFYFASRDREKARALLNEKPVIMTSRGYRIVDRWFRRKAYRDPMGKFYYGSTYEEPRSHVMQARITLMFGPGDISSWKGIPEIKP